MFETTNQLLLFHLEEMDVSRGNQVWKHVDGCWIDAGWIPIRAPKTGSYKNPKRNETTRPTRHPKSQHCASKLLNPTFLCYLYAIDMYWDAVSPSFSGHIFRKEAEPVVFGSGLPNGRAQHHSTQDVLHGAAPKANQVGLGYHGATRIHG